MTMMMMVMKIRMTSDCPKLAASIRTVHLSFRTQSVSLRILDHLNICLVVIVILLLLLLYHLVAGMSIIFFNCSCPLPAPWPPGWRPACDGRLEHAGDGDNCDLHGEHECGEAVVAPDVEAGGWVAE